MLLQIFLNLLFLAFVSSNTGSDCCAKINGPCYNVCEQVLDSREVEINSEIWTRFRRHCPFHAEQLWRCVNRTLKAEENEEIWFGKPCCDLAKSEECLHSCLVSDSLQQLDSFCAYTEEEEFFNCLHNRQIRNSCCKKSPTLRCYRSCKSTIEDDKSEDDIINNCGDTAVAINHCFKNHTVTTGVTFNPYKYFHCCRNVTSHRCMEACYSIITKSADTSAYSLVSKLRANGCNAESADETFWRCFLPRKNELVTEETDTKKQLLPVTRSTTISAKLHCCLKAVSPVCRKLCFQIFSNDWIHISNDFNIECLSYSAEEALNYCLDEAEEPCQVGCDGLNYCVDFNGKRNELFRSCTIEADNAARDDVTLWKSQGYFSIFGYQLPVKNISSCSPYMWKSLACMSRIKPCIRRTHSTSLCREDCYALLSHCLDWAKVPSDLSVNTLCSRFSLHNSVSSCISVQSYFDSEDMVPDVVVPSRRITTPCKDNPCHKPDQVCIVNRNCQPRNGNCRPYTCSPGCKLGPVSKYVIPEGTLVNLPLPYMENRCYKICQCINQKIEKCYHTPCTKLEHCWIHGRKIEHGRQFRLDCNMCVCFDGEITCTKTICEPLEIRDEEILSSLYPCGCMPRYVPVCGKNGKTYANACLAKCTGFMENDYTYGSCVGKDVCDESMCGENEICLPDRKVCLSSLHKFCPQYQCVNVQRSCKRLPHEPVCDTDGRDHSNICYMFKFQKTLAYKGYCVANCDRNSTVCGIDGNTYTSECHAHANMISVDYKGPCVASGFGKQYGNEGCSFPYVTCPPFSPPNCKYKVTPPGACCPICGAAIKLLFSRKQVDHLTHILKEHHPGALTVISVLKALERQVHTAECVIRGYMTIENEIFVLLLPSIPNPSHVQLETCAHEAEKLTIMIRKSSPRISTEFSLSIITSAITVNNFDSDFSTLSLSSCSSYFLSWKLFSAFLLLLVIPGMVPAYL